jgi:uncharacterized repeat protein (TIGR01451 family)
VRTRLREAMALLASVVLVACGLVALVGSPPASAAITVPPAPNPALPASCGINLALDFDLSNSITSPQFVQMRQASINLVTALQGTPSQVGVYTFATFAPATSGSGGTPNHPTIPGTQPRANFALPATPIATVGGATTVTQRIAGLTRVASASGGTNWDQGLSQLVAAGQPHYNAVLFITDGDPTTWGPNNNGSGTSTDDTTVNAAITSANAVKAAGTRVIAVGVSNTTGPAVRRLQYISGPTQNSDYYVTNWDALQQTLVSIATASCQGTITVVKQIRSLSGSTSPGGGWTFSATNTRGPVVPPSGVTSSAGTVNFTVPDSSTTTINETQQTGYQLVQQGGSNAVCTSGGYPVPSTNLGATGFSVPVGSRQILSCTVVNSLIPATLTLTKTVENPFGGDADPADWTLQAAGPQTISGPDGSGAVTGAKVVPGTYTLSELDGPDGYSPSAWVCTGASLTGNVVTLVAGDSATCGITNTELGVPVLTQNKTVDAATAYEGGTLIYTMTVGNSGTADATGVTATESLPAGVTFVSATPSTGSFDPATGVWTVGTVAVGTTETLTVTVTVNASTAGSTLVDRFAVTPPPGVGPPNVENPCADNPAQSCASTDVLPPPGAPELIQSKSVDQTTAVPGDTLTYTMGVANNGTADAAGVTATDTLPAGVTFATADTHGAGSYDPSTGIWSIGTVPSGGSATLTITATVNAGTEATTQINRFVITSTGVPVVVLDACPDVATESCAATTIPGVPQLVQNKVVDQATAPVGATLTYTMTLADTGTGDATGVVAQDTLPAGINVVSADTDGFGTFDATTGAWDIGTIGVGQTATLTVTATIEPQAAGSTLVNAFQVIESPDPPPLVVDNPCPSPDEDSSCASTTVPGIPQLTQSKVVDAETAAIGQTLTYSMAVGNTGSADATGVSAQDQLPPGVTFVRADTGGVGTFSPASGVWTIGTVPQGATDELTITATVNHGTDNTTQINRFVVNAPPGDPSPVVEQPCADDAAQSCATTWIPGTPQLVVAKTVNEQSAAVGASLTYTITVANAGTGDATDVVVQESPPSALALTSANTNGSGTFDPTALVWTLPLVSPGATATLTLVGTILSGASGTLTNRISVVAPPGAGPTVITDPCPDNPAQACASTSIISGATVVPAAAPGALAVTGLDLSGLLSYAALFLALGSLALVLSRRRVAGKPQAIGDLDEDRR